MKCLALLPVVFLGLAAEPPPAAAANRCLEGPGGACHQAEGAKMSAGRHVTTECEACHRGAELHLTSADKVKGPRPSVPFDMETCRGCHPDQYAGYLTARRGRTVFGGSDAGPTQPAGWSKTVDLPWWNVLIDGHPFVLETYEDSPMAVNQIEHQQTIRPGSEACLECHGSKVAYYMGITYRDAAGKVVTIPGRAVLIRNAHTVYDGTSRWNGHEWTEEVGVKRVPAGTTVSMYTDAVQKPLYQVKTLVTLGEPVTEKLPDGTSFTFRTVASYDHPQADLKASDKNAAKVTLARDWIYAAGIALGLDGLDYKYDPIDPEHPTHFSGSGKNWPTVQSGELCNQCHDPHSGRLRIVRKALIEAIAREGINPYSEKGRAVREFDKARRQDQIIAVCGQCHSEYVGGYSAITGIDYNFFPWGKPAKLEELYRRFFDYKQDWKHGGPVRPWQEENANARGYAPYLDARYPIDVPLVKSQHPEAEVFLESRMYKVGATCTDCHSLQVTRPDGTKYTSHWFTSPIKWITDEGASPCNKCHADRAPDDSLSKILDIQRQIYLFQEQAQVGLVNALRRIRELKEPKARDAAVKLFQAALLRWEYYAQAENSMGFHNFEEAIQELALARANADTIVPWPLTPVQLGLSGASPTALTLSWTDHTTDEDEFVIERKSGQEPFSEIWRVRGSGNATGRVSWTDVGLTRGQAYTYRVSASNARGQSVPTVPVTGAPAGEPSPPTGVKASGGDGRVLLRWKAGADAQEGTSIERAFGDGKAIRFLEIARVGPETDSFEDANAAPERSYSYRLRSFNSSGYSLYSAPVSASPGAKRQLPGGAEGGSR